MIDSYILDLSPFAIRFTQTFGIRWYGLAYLAGFACFYFFVRFLTTRGATQLQPEKIGDLVFALALGTVVGGRLGYCIFYSPELFTRFTSSLPFWGPLAINEGGMASHGGIIGIIVAAWLFARKHKVSALHLLDLAAVGGTLGIFFGRIANFVNGELVGRPVGSAISWSVKFPQDIFSWPTYEVQRLSTLTAVAEQIGVPTKTWDAWMRDFPFSGSSVQTVLSQIVESIQSGNVAVKNALAPLLTARHPSQLYEAGLEGLFLFLVLLLVWRRPQRPGLVAAVFGLLYPLVRIFGEQFRMPDLQIGFQLFGLTRGQWLSIGMLAIGFILLAFSKRHGNLKLGGWADGGRPKVVNPEGN